MRFMTEQHRGANFNPEHISTALEYAQAYGESDNRAGKQIDAGNEPYLVNLDALEMGLHPYVAVEDVSAELFEGDVELYTASRSYQVASNTVLVWR